MVALLYYKALWDSRLSFLATGKAPGVADAALLKAGSLIGLPMSRGSVLLPCSVLAAQAENIYLCVFCALASYRSARRMCLHDPM